jgi:hypothetical protein
MYSPKIPIATCDFGSGNQPLCQIDAAVMIDPNLGNNVTRLVVASWSVPILTVLFARRNRHLERLRHARM